MAPPLPRTPPPHPPPGQEDEFTLIMVGCVLGLAVGYAQMVWDFKSKADAERLIAKFEEEEARLIQRLKVSQRAQQSELSKLEQTVLSPAP